MYNASFASPPVPFGLEYGIVAHGWGYTVALCTIRDITSILCRVVLCHVMSCGIVPCGLCPRVVRGRVLSGDYVGMKEKETWSIDTRRFGRRLIRSTVVAQRNSRALDNQC